MTYYFMFSEGSYSDYMVGGMYSCDHEVTEDEWHSHLAAYETERTAKQVEIYGHDFNKPYSWQRHTREQHVEMSAWSEANDPDKTFVAKHNMTRVAYEEFWR
jgi:hypothetical protein